MVKCWYEQQNTLNSSFDVAVIPDKTEWELLTNGQNSAPTTSPQRWLPDYQVLHDLPVLLNYFFLTNAANTYKMTYPQLRPNKNYMFLTFIQLDQKWHTHTHTQIHTDTPKTHKIINTDIHADTPRHRHRQSHTYTHTYSQIDTQTQTKTHTDTHTVTHTHAHTHIHTNISAL